MNATQSSNGVAVRSIATLPYSPVTSTIEGSHLASMLGLMIVQVWSQASAEVLKVQHDLLMAALGYAPHEHVAPWDTLARSNGAAWFEAMDKVLKAIGD